MRTITTYPDMTIGTKATHGIHNSDIRLRWGEQFTYKQSWPSCDLESIVMEIAPEEQRLRRSRTVKGLFTHNEI